MATSDWYFGDGVHGVHGIHGIHGIGGFILKSQV
jgi:hypothetical protein